MQNHVKNCEKLRFCGCEGLSKRRYGKFFGALSLISQLFSVLPAPNPQLFSVHVLKNRNLPSEHSGGK
jgi:hypothetical protein